MWIKMWGTRGNRGVIRGWRAGANNTENELKGGHIRRVQVTVMTATGLG